MRTLGYGVVVGMVLLTAGRAPTQPSIGFYLEMRGPAATDIVVTDSDGLVLETWRGEFRPGDTVRLGPARLTPVNALPWEYLRFRSKRAVSGWYREPRPGSQFAPAQSVWSATAEVETDLRLVLFLRKEATAAELGAIWLPAATRAEGAPAPVEGHATYAPRWRDRYISASPDDFASSVAFVEAGCVLAFQETCVRWGIKEMAPFAGTVSDFKFAALQLPAQ